MTIPEGWKESPDVAVDLVDNLFFAFKTPLKGSGDFTVDHVFNHAVKQKWNIGLWIDLTNTQRYYQPSQVQSKGVAYVKIPVVGRQSPSLQEILAFNTMCAQFLVENPSKIIGIHCTHGFNRTGFLICSFLSQVKRLDAHAALKKFAEARPPGIYRQNMVNDFVQYFGTQGCPPAPKVSNPPWKVGNTFEKAKRKAHIQKTEVTNGKRLNMTKDGSSGQNKNQHQIRQITEGESFQKYLTKYSDNVTPEIQKKILTEIRVLTGRCENDSNFCGRKHSNLNEADFESMKSGQYMVTWFPQEYFRYLLYFDSSRDVYFVDTFNHVIQLRNFVFPSSSSPSERLSSTLIEGIILRKYVTKFDGSISSEYHFEISDLVTFEGQDFRAEGLGSRLRFLRGILESRRLLTSPTSRTVDFPSDPFRIRVQPVWSTSNFWKLRRFDWFHSYPVGPNALIFYPVNNTAEASQTILWLCPETNSACFRLFKESSCSDSNPVPVTKFYLRTDDNTENIEELLFGSDEEFNLYDSLVGDLIECLYNNLTKSWTYKRHILTRSFTDTFDFVQRISGQELSGNITTKKLFDYYGAPHKAS